MWLLLILFIINISWPLIKFTLIEFLYIDIRVFLRLLHLLIVHIVHYVLHVSILVHFWVVVINFIFIQIVFFVRQIETHFILFLFVHFFSFLVFIFILLINLIFHLGLFYSVMKILKCFFVTSFSEFLLIFLHFDKIRIIIILPFLLLSGFLSWLIYLMEKKRWLVLTMLL